MDRGRTFRRPTAGVPHLIHGEDLRAFLRARHLLSSPAELASSIAWAVGCPSGRRSIWPTTSRGTATPDVCGAFVRLASGSFIGVATLRTSRKSTSVSTSHFRMRSNINRSRRSLSRMLTSTRKHELDQTHGPERARQTPIICEFLKDVKGRDEASLDAVAKAIDRFEGD